MIGQTDFDFEVFSCTYIYLLIFSEFLIAKRLATLNAGKILLYIFLTICTFFSLFATDQFQQKLLSNNPQLNSLFFITKRWMFTMCPLRRYCFYNKVMNVYNVSIEKVLFSWDNKFDGSWLNSRPFSPFTISLAGIRQYELLLKMRFLVLKLHFLL